MKVMRILPIGFMLAAMSDGLISGATAPASAEQEVLRVEQARVRALLAGDAAALEPLLADELIFVHVSGWSQNKAEYVESIRRGELKYEVVEQSAVRVRVYGDAAVLTGRSAVKVRSERRQGQLLDVQALFTAVYAKTADRWQLAVWQSTAARQP
jgi:ketosteroid isomerase-like protein